jgi:hypothetical protein
MCTHQTLTHPGITALSTLANAAGADGMSFSDSSSGLYEGILNPLRPGGFSSQQTTVNHGRESDLLSIFPTQSVG